MRREGGRASDLAIERANDCKLQFLRRKSIWDNCIMSDFDLKSHSFRKEKKRERNRQREREKAWVREPEKRGGKTKYKNRREKKKFVTIYKYM